MLNRINYASASTLELLDYILGNPECHHIRILAFENESGRSRVFEMDYHRRFVEHCEAKHCLFEWGADGEEVENAIENSFVFNVENMETYLRHSYNMYCMFAPIAAGSIPRRSVMDAPSSALPAVMNKRLMNTASCTITRALAQTFAMCPIGAA